MSPNTTAPRPRKAQEVTPLTVAVAGKLRGRAGELKVTNVELIKRTHMAKNLVGEIMAGTKVPNTAQLELICKVLDLTLTDLYMAAEAAVQAENHSPGRRASNG